MGGGVASGGYFKVSAGRRRQMCAVLYLNFFTGPILVVLFLYLLWRIFQPWSLYIFTLYVSIIIFDNRTRPMPCRSRVSQWVRECFLFKLFRDYFPIRVMKAKKDTEFDNKRNYLFCYHPHGVQSAGAMACASAAAG